MTIPATWSQPHVTTLNPISSEGLTTEVRERRDATFRAERWQALSGGIIETASYTFLLLVAVRYFQAGATAKAMVAAAGSVGLIVSPAVVTHIGHVGGRPARVAAWLYLIGGLGFLAASLFPQLSVFIIGSTLAMMAVTCSIPLMIQIYQDNYPENERGRLFSRTVMIRIVVAAGFSQLAGWQLGSVSGLITLLQMRALLLVFAVAMFAGAYRFTRYPSRPLLRAASRNPLQAMRYLREDAIFRRALVSWMLMGFANLMMLPMRVEYLANPRFGLALSVAMIAFLTGVVPNVARLLVSPVWGHLFDRLNFFLLRVVLNVGFAVGIVTFFTGQTTAGLVWGSIIFGISNAGGDVAWSLWVTKIAPPERVADYMSIHTFFTGLRGMAAPFAAFYLVQRYSPQALGWVAAILIALASLVILPEVRWRARSPRKTPLTSGTPE